jgi:hypothetical protein
MDPRSLPVTEQIEYYAARHIWRMRDKETPSGEGLWRDWYLQRFGRTLQAASEDFRRDNEREGKGKRSV